MSYNRTSRWSESQQAVENLSLSMTNLDARVQSAYLKLVSLKVDRVAMYDAEQALYDADPYDPDTNPTGHQHKYGTPGLTDPNAKMAATYYPDENIPVEHIDAAEESLVSLKAGVDGTDMAPIIKFA